MNCGRALAVVATVAIGCAAVARAPASVDAKRCAAGDDPVRPYVVAWDGTTIAELQAIAARGTVFVRSDGCEVALVHCADENEPGRFGAYLHAQWTPGAEATSDFPGVAPEAKLRSFVSGTVRATRDAIAMSEIEGTADCREATHFVAEYAVGAFELTWGPNDPRRRRAGDFSACAYVREGVDGCRAPIRLTLRAIDRGAP